MRDHEPTQWPESEAAARRLAEGIFSHCAGETDTESDPCRGCPGWTTRPSGDWCGAVYLDRSAPMEPIHASPQAKAFAHLRGLWLGLRDDACPEKMAAARAIAVAIEAVGAITSLELELWVRRFEACPGHINDGRRWCAYCGDMPARPSEGP